MSETVKRLRLYLDACCLNRPFDDQLQERVHLESEAVLLIIEKCRNGLWHWIGSDILLGEIEKTPDVERRKRVLAMTRYAHEVAPLIAAAEERADELIEAGFDVVDALHLACAEYTQADVFLSTDDKLVKRAKRLSPIINLTVENPLLWLQEFNYGDDT